MLTCLWDHRHACLHIRSSPIVSSLAWGNTVASCDNRTQMEINTGLQLTAARSTDLKTPGSLPKPFKPPPPPTPSHPPPSPHPTPKQRCKVSHWWETGKAICRSALHWNVGRNCETRWAISLDPPTWILLHTNKQTCPSERFQLMSVNMLSVRCRKALCEMVVILYTIKP